jgi:outer membrane protein TolC
MDKRPEALAATVEVAAAKKGIQIARGANGPSLTMSLSGYHYPSTSFVSPRENVGALTFSLSIPVFDGGLGREQVSEAKSLVETAEADQDHTRRQIALQVQNAALDVDTAKKRLDAAQVAESSADQARKLAQQRYEAQVGLYLEVTDAQAALTAAQSAVNDATYDLLTAEARLARAINDPIVP